MLCNINAASFYINFILSENQSTVNTQQEVFNLMIVGLQYILDRRIKRMKDKASSVIVGVADNN